MSLIVRVRTMDLWCENLDLVIIWGSDLWVNSGFEDIFRQSCRWLGVFDSVVHVYARSTSLGVPECHTYGLILRA